MEGLIYPNPLHPESTHSPVLPAQDPMDESWSGHTEYTVGLLLAESFTTSTSHLFKSQTDI